MANNGSQSQVALFHWIVRKSHDFFKNPQKCIVIMLAAFRENDFPNCTCTMYCTCTDNENKSDVAAGQKCEIQR